ncbi:MAG: LysR family transcriptional regulator [Eggerthellaceae bacterium]
MKSFPKGSGDLWNFAICATSWWRRKSNNLSQAARELNISQPSLSYAVKAIETELGVTLFERRGKHLCLNRDGEYYAKEIDRALTIIDQAGKDLTEGELRRNKVVNCSMNIPLGNVGKVLNAFYERCPDVVVNTGYANSGTFKNRGIDMNLFGNRLDIDDPDVVKLGFERYLLVLPKDHPLASRESVSLREVKDGPFVFSEYGTPLFNDVCDMFEAVGGSPNIVATSQVSLDVLSMVSAGVGYCVAPEFSWLVGMEGNFVTVPIQGSQHGRYLYARFNNAYRPSEAALSFANFLQDLVEGVVEVN